MPRRCVSHTLDVNLDFARPRSMTLSAEELKSIPSPQKHSDPNLERKIRNSIQDVGICRGLTKLRKVLGGREESHQQTLRKDQEEYSKSSRQTKPYRLQSPMNIPRLKASRVPHYYKGDFDSPGSEFLTLSPQISMNTMSSPSMHASLSTPEYTPSEVESFEDEISDISSPVSSLVIGPRNWKPMSSPSLQGTVRRLHISEFRNDNDDYDNDNGRRELQEQIEIAIEELKN